MRDAGATAKQTPAEGGTGVCTPQGSARTLLRKGLTGERSPCLPDPLLAFSAAATFRDGGVAEIQLKTVPCFPPSICEEACSFPDSGISAEELTSIIYGLQGISSLRSNLRLDPFSEALTGLRVSSEGRPHAPLRRGRWVARPSSRPLSDSRRHWPRVRLASVWAKQA